jgi:hypothetical protein
MASPNDVVYKPLPMEALSGFNQTVKAKTTCGIIVEFNRAMRKTVTGLLNGNLPNARNKTEAGLLEPVHEKCVSSTKKLTRE